MLPLEMQWPKSCHRSALYKCKPHLEGVILTASGDTDPLIIEHRAAQVITATALQAGIRIW